MRDARPATEFPLGGLAVGRGSPRAWKWSGNEARLTQPLRCRKDQWYVARAIGRAANRGTAAMLVRFLRDGEPLAEQCVRLHAAPSRNGVTPLMGWVQSPVQATHVQVGMFDPAAGHAPLSEVVLRPAAERDPKCHPGANVPRWSAYEPPFPLTRLVLPQSLRALADLVPQRDIVLLDDPKSFRRLAARSMGAAVILDPQWVRDLPITAARLEQLGSLAYVLLDLQSFADSLKRGGHRGIECRTHAVEHQVMSARVIYADLATRGFALQDVFPCAALDERNRFATRSITMNAAWKRYADDHDCAPLLASETPWIKWSGDILAAVRAVGRGEILATDLPWLAAGAFGPPLAPRLATQVLHTQLGGAVADHVQYWNRWDETHIVVRDLLDLARRYPPLRAIRWNSPEAGAARLGLTLPPLDAPAKRHLLISTGRIDMLGPHDGLAPEALAIFMKWLARESRERTRWATQHLSDTTVTIQFDTHGGLRYAHTYEAAPPAGAFGAERRIVLRCDEEERSQKPERPSAGGGAYSPHVTYMPDDVGVFGDGSHAFQDRLTRVIRSAVEARP